MAEKKERRQDPTPSRKKRKRRRTPTGAPRLDPQADDGALAERIHGLLAQLYRRVAEGDPEGRPPLSIRFDPASDPAAFSQDLLDAFRSCAAPARGAASYLEGRVYCYHCETPCCAHAEPPNHLSVFQGYTPTGFPIWTEFAAVLLDARSPRIDGLMQEDAEIVALCQEKKELNAEQLPVFGKESQRYDILGQIVAGYLPYPRREPQARMAVTLQAVRCLEAGSPRLRLNLIGRVPGGVDLVAHFRAAPDPDFEGLVHSARKRLAGFPPRGRSDAGGGGRASSFEAALLSVLRHLAAGIERIHRRSRRRTRHAALRSSERPAVGLALKDAEKAAEDRFLYDELHHTYIVIGPKWRTHVFGPDGRHVTSMQINREGFQKRLDQRRWRFLDRLELAGLKEKVAQWKGRAV